MKKVLIICFTDLEKDPRVIRQIRFLKDKFEVSAVGLKSADEDNVVFYPIERSPASFLQNVKKAFLFKIRLFEKVYWDTYKYEALLNLLSGKKFDLIISNDIESLPFALRIANGAKILLDAHEYTPREFEDRFLWRFFLKDYKEYLCKKYIKCCDRMITVSGGIANEYYKNFNIKPNIITNACDYVNIKPTHNSKFIKLIHHGGAIPSRKIESMLKMMDYLDNSFTLDLMLLPTVPTYLKKLKYMAKDKDKIKFLKPVPTQEVVNCINKYDIGVYILEENSFNNKYALPNKFFDFIQARLALAIGPSPEMAKIVRQYDCGIIAKDFEPESMAKELSRLTRDKIDYYKNQSDKAAHELSSERNRQKLENLAAELLKL